MKKWPISTCERHLSAVVAVAVLATPKTRSSKNWSRSKYNEEYFLQTNNIYNEYKYIGYFIRSSEISVHLFSSTILIKIIIFMIKTYKLVPKGGNNVTMSSSKSFHLPQLALRFISNHQMVSVECNHHRCCCNHGHHPSHHRHQFRDRQYIFF